MQPLISSRSSAAGYSCRRQLGPTYRQSQFLSRHFIGIKMLFPEVQVRYFTLSFTKVKVSPDSVSDSAQKRHDGRVATLMALNLHDFHSLKLIIYN